MKTTILVAAILATGLSTAAVARDRMIYAPVVRVTPVVDIDEVPREVCRDEVVERYERRDRGTGGAIAGAIIGGLVGNQVGSGSGRRAATVAGAVAGGAIGRNVDRRNGSRPRYVRGVQTECWTEYDRAETVVAYDVDYRYRGRIYRTRTYDEPGSRVRVYVDDDYAYYR